MSIETLISRLSKVKRTGRNRYIACCPAHEDRTPSLAISELDNGIILLKCHAECDTFSVLSAVGLSFEDLYPERLPEHHYPKIKNPFPAADVLKCLRNEALIVAVAGANQAQGRTLGLADRERAMLAAERILRAVS